MDLDRFWFFTWTTYGTWLPGDPRGNVTSVKDRPGPRRRNNLPGTPMDGAIPGLHGWAEKHLQGTPVFLTKEQAEQVMSQFHETTSHRK